MEDYALSSELPFQVSDSASSSAWYSEWSRLCLAEQKLSNRITEWDVYINKLQGLSGGGRVAVIKSSLNQARTSINNGGYVDNGVGLCSSDIKKELSKMDNLGEDIDSVIDDTIEAYDKMTKNLTEFGTQISSAWSKFLAACARESQESFLNGQGVKSPFQIQQEVMAQNPAPKVKPKITMTNPFGIEK